MQMYLTCKDKLMEESFFCCQKLMVLAKEQKLMDEAHFKR